MNIKHLLFLFIVSGTLLACNGGNRKFVISGKIAGMPMQTVILEQLSANDIITIIDSERSDGDGSFEITGNAPEPGLYRLHFRSNRFILLSVDKGNVDVKGDWKTIENYTVNGSSGSENLRNFIVGIRTHLRDVTTMNLVLDTLQVRGKDSLLGVAKKDMQDIQVHFTEYVERFADTTPYEPNAIFAVRMLNAVTEANYLETFSRTLQHRFPGNKMTKDYGEYYTKLMNRITKPKPQSGKVDVGNVAPEIPLSDPDGKPVKLSSLKGKFILIEFWASWSKPCRAESASLVALNEKLKNKNFAMFSVSLDNNKEEWAKAIKDDKRTWLQGSDLKGMNADAARLYGVQSVPYNFILDATGKVIARDIHGTSLEALLTAAIH